MVLFFEWCGVRSYLSGLFATITLPDDTQRLMTCSRGFKIFLEMPLATSLVPTKITTHSFTGARDYLHLLRESAQCPKVVHHTLAMTVHGRIFCISSPAMPLAWLSPTTVTSSKDIFSSICPWWSCTFLWCTLLLLSLFLVFLGCNSRGFVVLLLCFLTSSKSPSISKSSEQFSSDDNMLNCLREVMVT